MSTEAQIAANRANALKSSGPQTPEGKARVAQNAITHGLTAAAPVHPAEDPADFQIFRDNMLADLAPESPLDLYSAESIIATAWRLRRIPGIELQVHTSASGAPQFAAPSDADQSYPDQADSFRPSAEISMAAGWMDSVRSLKLTNLNRHEAHLHRILSRDLNTYFRRRQLRASEQKPDPSKGPNGEIMIPLSGLIDELQLRTKQALAESERRYRESQNAPQL